LHLLCKIVTQTEWQFSTISAALNAADKMVPVSPKLQPYKSKCNDAEINDWHDTQQQQQCVNSISGDNSTRCKNTAYGKHQLPSKNSAGDMICKLTAV